MLNKDSTIILRVELIGTEPVALQQSLAQLVSGDWKQGGIPEKWDGLAAERIIKWFVEV